MSEIDPLIDARLAEEERALLRAMGEEPPFLLQTLGLFGGPNGWVTVVLTLFQAAMFFGGAWAAWRFFGATDVLEALRWGLPAAVLLIMSLVVKMAMWPLLHLNRVIAELKRLGLLVASR